MTREEFIKMRKVYFEELNRLFEEFVVLGQMVEDAVKKSMEALTTQNAELAREVVDGDIYINEKETELIKEAVQIIALQQPVVKDLRRVITVLSSSKDLERMGDHARSIAYNVIDINQVDESAQRKIEEMGKISVQMIVDMIEAFKNEDKELALEVISRDDLLDDLKTEIQSYALKELQAVEDIESSSFIEYMAIASQLERIGDYVTNLGEQLVYLTTGETIELNGSHMDE